MRVHRNIGGKRDSWSINLKGCWSAQASTRQLVTLVPFVKSAYVIVRHSIRGSPSSLHVIKVMAIVFRQALDRQTQVESIAIPYHILSSGRHSLQWQGLHRRNSRTLHLTFASAPGRSWNSGTWFFPTGNLRHIVSNVMHTYIHERDAPSGIAVMLFLISCSICFVSSVKRGHDAL